MQRAEDTSHESKLSQVHRKARQVHATGKFSKYFPAAKIITACEFLTRLRTKRAAAAESIAAPYLRVTVRARCRRATALFRSICRVDGRVKSV